jgi:hypothetical protein
MGGQVVGDLVAVLIEGVVDGEHRAARIPKHRGRPLLQKGACHYLRA